MRPLFAGILLAMLAAPLAGQDIAPASTTRPAQQIAFEAFLRSYAQRSEEAPNALARQNLRRERATRFIPSGFGGARDWLGTVGEIVANSRGRAVLLVMLADGSQLMSNDGRRGLGEVGVIQRGAAVFNVVSDLRPGQRIRFDATFLCLPNDCPVDLSTDPAETLATPRFVTHFRRITALD